MKHYNNYQEYLDHQSQKMKLHYDEVRDKNIEIRDLVYERYHDLFDFKAKTVICLGARLGGEVESFKKMGALAVGIDIDPGQSNKHVLHGDFHDINFPSSCFDYVFCNCIDHVYNFDRFFEETSRILKDDGVIFYEIGVQRAGEYETIDTTDISGLRNQIAHYFTVTKELPVDNGWRGVLLILKKNT